MEDWDPSQHIPMYLKSDVLPGDSQSLRAKFWFAYNSASKVMGQWLASLPEEQKCIYQRFTLAPVSRASYGSELLVGLSFRWEVSMRLVYVLHLVLQEFHRTEPGSG